MRNKKITFINGAMGTNLSAAGFTPGPEANLEHAEGVKKNTFRFY